MFVPYRSAAIVGASEEPGRIGSGLYRAVSASVAQVYCVNPGHETLFSQPCYASLEAIGAPIELCLIAVRRDRVFSYVRSCAALGVRTVVVISAGFKEADAEGARLERQLSDYAREQGLFLLGPNTLGFIDTEYDLNATFLPGSIPAGPVSVISQSGGVGIALITSLQDQRCGLRRWVGIGNEAVVDAGQILRLLAEDEKTKVIAVCFEGLKNLGDFLPLAAEVNRTKPVILLRDGKSQTGKTAAASHTGTLVQSDALMRALFSQYGLLEAENCRDCAVMCKALSVAPRCGGNRALVLTNTAGPSILAADVMEPLGVRLPAPSAPLNAAVDAACGVPMNLKNPADISSNGLSPARYAAAAKTYLCSEEYDLLLGFFTLNPHLQLPDGELIEAAQAAGKPVVACFLGSEEAFSRYPAPVESFGIPCFCEAHDAAVACAAITGWRPVCRRAEEAGLTQAQTQSCREFLAGFPSGAILCERQSRILLQKAGIEVPVPTVLQPGAAIRCTYPAVVKVESNRISHKSDVGGVAADLPDEAAVLAAWDTMRQTVCAIDPEARFTVQPMSPPGFELLLSAARTALGCIVTLGFGGVHTEIFADYSFCRLPADDADFRKMLRSLRCAPILSGVRGAPAADIDAVCALLGRLAALLASVPTLKEVELNPCRVYPDGLHILDARVILL